jgi:hypothetical protein
MPGFGQSEGQNGSGQGRAGRRFELTPPYTKCRHPAGLLPARRAISLTSRCLPILLEPRARKLTGLGSRGRNRWTCQRTPSIGARWSANWKYSRARRKWVGYDSMSGAGFRPVASNWQWNSVRRQAFAKPTWKCPSATSLAPSPSAQFARLRAPSNSLGSPLVRPSAHSGR